MKNVQITIDEETLSQIDKVGGPLGLKRSEIVRRALRDWLQRQAIDGFEQQWVSALKKHPDKAARAEDWAPAQTWSKK
jgi:metal-responsive CopG/Arc/MetJ family transcriptional regulator